MNEIGKEILKRDLLAFKTKEELVEMDMNLLDEIDNLQSKIDKAIECIESHRPSDIGMCGNKMKYYYTLGEDSVDNLLDILKEDK